MPYLANWNEIKKTYETWWRHQLPRPVVQVLYPPECQSGNGTYNRWAYLKYNDDLAAIRACIGRFDGSMCYAGDAFPSAFVNLGAGVVASYFSGFLQFDEFNQTAWFERPHPWELVEKMSFEDDNPWWQHTKRATEIYADVAKDRFIVGCTDLGGVLDILASLRGAENLLLDLVDAPTRVDEMRARILDAWHRAYDDLAPIVAGVQEGTSSWLRIWCPGDYAALQCDLSAMISPAMFETFVAPDVQEQARRLGHAIYHLDGPGQVPHVDLLLEIPELDGIQWVPGSRNPQCDSPQYFPMYEKILNQGKLLVLQSFDNVENIPRMLERLPHRGLLLTVGMPNRDAAQRFLDTVSTW